MAGVADSPGWCSTNTLQSHNPMLPLSNESAIGGMTYEKALGWQAVLEKVHGMGDNKWLVQYRKDTEEIKLVSNNDDRDILFPGYRIADMYSF